MKIIKYEWKDLKGPGRHKTRTGKGNIEMQVKGQTNVEIEDYICIKHGHDYVRLISINTKE